MIADACCCRIISRIHLGAAVIRKYCGGYSRIFEEGKSKRFGLKPNLISGFFNPRAEARGYIIWYRIFLIWIDLIAPRFSAEIKNKERVAALAEIFLTNNEHQKILE